jgi:hypothetical protein
MKIRSPKQPKPKKVPLKVVVDREQRIVLEDIARAMVLSYRDVVRARTILMLADGVSQAEVARRVRLRRRIARPLPRHPSFPRSNRGRSDREGTKGRPDRAAAPAAARRRVGTAGQGAALEWDLIQKSPPASAGHARAGAARRPVRGRTSYSRAQWLSARVCPHCGHPPDDFVDEDTIAG